MQYILDGLKDTSIEKSGWAIFPKYTSRLTGRKMVGPNVTGPQGIVGLAAVVWIIFFSDIFGPKWVWKVGAIDIPEKAIGRGTPLDLILVLGLWTWDDWGTAVGFQAHDTGNEGNTVISNVVKYLVDKGYAANETQAFMRIVIWWEAAIVFTYFKWGWSPSKKAILYLGGLLKAYAGNGWHDHTKDHNYLEALSYLFGDKGKRTPEKVDISYY